MQTLLRPHQVNELHDERDSLERKLSNPHIQDKGVVSRQLSKLRHQLDTQTPVMPEGKEKDVLIKQEKELKEKWLSGMPSYEEMRKSPPGAVGKHMAWEKRNKENILKWKNARLRLNVGTEDPDIANIELHRPNSNTLNMNGAQIPGKYYFMPSADPEYGEKHDRIFAEKSIVTEVVDQSTTITTTEDKPKKRIMSAENREKASERMKAMHEKKRQEKLEAKEGVI